MPEIMKIIDERERQKTKTERNKGDANYIECGRAKWLCWAFKLGFLELIFKASLILMSNLELALSIFLKQRKLYESNHLGVECTCLKTWGLLSFLICSSILVLKWRQVLPIS